ncbi:MAG: DNA mismatch repair endonuclease MutL, partial [Chloroflexota bacterium]|nr:DNA mismatch repair endonuclease MutL [Chloroflexota bacterium]
MSIRRLPPEISGKIAAGEVIERPASVVRELLDNALDAGARRIDVAVEQGGKALIQITDDGSGIPPDQVALAVERHSTSKLTTVDDLARIQTLGFRGEALASIAAVAELSLRSVTADGQPGREVLARDERVIEERPVGGARGTRVTVRGLFRTIPARLEFLKAERTELGHIVAAVTRAALGHPHVAFRLHDGHRERVRTPGDGDLRTALLAIYGATLVDELIELPPGETLGIDGFVSQPHLQRSSRADIALFVNGRWVSDRLLSAAVSEAYRSVMPTGRFPVILLNLTIPPEEVDVNVHPS